MPRKNIGERFAAKMPGVCDVCITNLCNATCDFCAFAHDKGLVGDRRFVSRSGFAAALPISRGQGIGYVNFQGGEPLLRPDIEGLVKDAREAGMHVGLITNGWRGQDRPVDRGRLGHASGLDRQPLARRTRAQPRLAAGRRAYPRGYRVRQGGRPAGPGPGDGQSPLGSVFDFAALVEMRDRCTRCMMSCYRDKSVLMHAAVAATDAAAEVTAGHPAKAASLLFRRSVALSLAAVVEAAPTIRRLARRPGLQPKSTIMGLSTASSGE